LSRSSSSSVDSSSRKNEGEGGIDGVNTVDDEVDISVDETSLVMEGSGWNGDNVECSDASDDNPLTTAKLEVMEGSKIMEETGEIAGSERARIQAEEEENVA
jgi:hypothetical protein